MSVIIKGSLLPFLQSETWDYDPVRGFIHHINFKGASQAAMQGLQQDYVRAGIACRLTFNQGDTATFDVEDSTMQYTLDTWQIVGNEESRDGLSHPKLTNDLIAAGLDPETYIALMRRLLEEQSDPATLFAPDGALDTTVSSVEPFYRLQARGSTEYRRAQYVLRHTTNAPNQWNSNTADVGIDQIYTTAQLLTETQDGSLWIVPLPSRLAYKLANIPVPTFQPGYMWGWLKGASTETKAPNNRICIETEYVLEQWNTTEYPPY